MDSFIEVWGKACSDYATRQLNKLNKQTLTLKGESSDSIEFKAIDPITISGLKVHQGAQPSYEQLYMDDEDEAALQPRQNIPEPTESYREESIAGNTELYDSFRMNPQFSTNGKSPALKFSHNSPYVKLTNSRRSINSKKSIRTPITTKKLSQSPHYQNCTSFSPKRTVKK